MVFIIDNNKKCFWAANQNVRMISERSCDSEDCSNNTEIIALHHRNELHYKIYWNRYMKYFYCIFNKVNTALVSIRDL